eukprot:COSAG02_NODE_5494_length_4283_cov_8.585325_4_plen_153_part_01
MTAARRARARRSRRARARAAQSDADDAAAFTITWTAGLEWKNRGSHQRANFMESTDDDPSDDDHQPPAAPQSSITSKPIIVPAPGETEHPADFASYQAHGTHYQGLDSDQKEDIRRQLRDETIAQQLSQPSQPDEQGSSVTGDVDDDTSRLTW